MGYGGTILNSPVTRQGTDIYMEEWNLSIFRICHCSWVLLQHAVRWNSYLSNEADHSALHPSLEGNKRHMKEIGKVSSSGEFLDDGGWFATYHEDSRIIVLELIRYRKLLESGQTR
jgi:hypothetical protein